MSDGGASGSPRPRVSTIARVGALLALFTPERPSWRLAELAQQLGWDAATTHRLANALVEIRLLDRREEESAYQLGVLTLELGSVYLSAHPSSRRVVEEMELIAERTGLTVQIGVLASASVSIVDSRESASPLRAAALLGQRLPLHATAAGKAILAQLPDGRALELLGEELEELTPRTITDPETLLDQLAEVRRSGLAHAEGELADGLCATAVALPPGSYSNDLAALTCAGPPRSIVAEPWDLAESMLKAVPASLAEANDGRRRATPLPR
jgi:DNA-binding IclR family transcriptional regulator